MRAPVTSDADCAAQGLCNVVTELPAYDVHEHAAARHRAEQLGEALTERVLLAAAGHARGPPDAAVAERHVRANAGVAGGASCSDGEPLLEAPHLHAPTRAHTTSVKGLETSDTTACSASADAHYAAAYGRALQHLAVSSSSLTCDCCTSTSLRRPDSLWQLAPMRCLAVATAPTAPQQSQDRQAQDAQGESSMPDELGGKKEAGECECECTWDDERGVRGALDRAINAVCLLLGTGACIVVKDT